MLQRIRDGASGPLAYVVVALIALVFGVWGIGSYFTPSANPVVATVGDAKITHGQLQQAFSQRYARLKQMMGNHFDASLMPPEQVRQSVLQSLIQRAVIDQYANNQGYKVTDADVLNQLRSTPQFQDNGQFSKQRYMALLSQAGIAPAAYEASLRKGLKSQEVQQQVASSAFATPSEVDQVYKLAHQQRRVGYLAFDPAAYRGQIKISDADIQKYYKAHPKQFQRPQRVKLAYVSLDRASAASGAPNQKTLRKVYDQNKDKLGSPEKRSAEEIRVPIGASGDNKARSTIQALAKAVGSGQSLKAAAKGADGATYKSIDAQPQKALPGAVGQALFGLKKGQTSNPVRGDKAWYLLRVTGVTPASTPAFNDPKMQAQLQAIASAQASAEAFRSKSDKLDKLSYQAPNDLKTIAKQTGLKIQHSGWISARATGQDNQDSGSGIGQYDAVRKAAFSDAVLQDHLNSEVIDLGSDRKVVLRVADTQPAKRKPLKVVASEIRQRLTMQKATAQAKEVAGKALAKARGGQNLKSLAGQYSSAKLHQPGFIGRSDQKNDPRVVEAAFNMPPPDKSKKARYHITSTNDGHVALVAVTGLRTGGSDKKKAKSERKQLARQQRQYMAGLEFSTLSDYLRQQAKVEVDRDNLN